MEGAKKKARRGLDALITSWVLEIFREYLSSFDINARAALILARQPVDSMIDYCADSAQELDARFPKMLASRFWRGNRIRYGLQREANEIADRVDMRSSATSARSLRCFAHTFSPSSTISLRFSSLARSGCKPAIVVGNPTWRRMVPTSITSSSPFLNTPTSPFSAKGISSVTR